MKRMKISKRLMSFLLCLALVINYLPLAFAEPAVSVLSKSAITDTIVDPGTADSWETMMGTNADGNRYAGRVWVDKSVYKNGDIVKFNSRNDGTSSYQVVLKDDEAFQIVFSALGSTMTTKSTISSTGPLDVVLILDTSTSMDDTSNGVTRLERVIKAANSLIDDLLTIPNVRIAIVTYNRDSETVLPLETRSNGIDLVVTDYYNNGSSDAGVVTAYDNNGKKLGNDSGYTAGTNLQAGIDRGFNILANATNVENRVPVAIVLTDGQANRANRTSFYSGIGEGSSASDERLFMGTLLNAAYNKTKIEENYGTEQKVYGVGVDLGTNATAHALMNPGDTSNRGFNGSNRTTNIRNAYNDFVSWKAGRTITYGSGNSKWTFDHSYPNLNGAITDAKIAANINYVDTYYDVTSAKLEDTFQQIYEELSSGAFNPISTSTSVDGATGQDDTPLIYEDFIGQYMEVKEIQAVSLFGSSYGVIKNDDGTYTVTTGTGANPTTNEVWNTTEDILISVTEQPDGTQKLEIKINQEILPILLERVVSETVGNVTTATITELIYEPLRVFYTIGLDSDILLPNGKVDVAKIQGYPFVDNTNGTVSFYSNRFGVMNKADGNGVVRLGDAHVGFQPSAENRYYYHQTNQGIFTKITNKTDGSVVTIPENAEYGIVWDETKYDLTWMSYEEYQAAKDTDRVYTYVTYYHPTASQTDANQAAEKVTYIVYTDWGYLKESAAFYDSTTEKYLNNGVAIPQDQVADTIAAYKLANPNAELYAVLGVGSVRTSRLHNMTVVKTENRTQTATERYTPQYTHTPSAHNDNDVVVWLGNNGKLTVAIDTGIALTKNVTEPIGNADDRYALTVTVPAGVQANPVVIDATGHDITTTVSTYINRVLTVNIKAGETVYISGIPGGTVCTIGENIPSTADYYIANKTSTVTVPTVSEALNGAAQFVPAFVTNAPNQYGNIFITKEIESDHTVPDSVLNTSFEVTVHVGTALAGKTFTVEDSAHTAPYTKTVDVSGNMVFQIKATQTIEILRLPAGTAVTVTESAPGAHFAVTYRTRNHTGENADADNAVVIPADGNATAVVINRYTPAATSVDLDIAGTKNFTVEGNHDGGTFYYKVQKWNGTDWEDLDGKTAETAYGVNESGTKHFTIADVLAGITYTEVGIHSYQVLEVKGNVANVTYDRTLYTFDVIVTDNGGQLVATVADLNNSPVTDGSYEVTFHNTYHTAPVSIDISKVVNNLSGDTTVSAAGFVFQAVRTDASWNPITGTDASVLTVHSDAAGKARVTATYQNPGTYHYVLSEVNAQAPGWTYSAAQYRITVTVTEHNGELTGTMEILKVNSQNGKETAAVDAADATKGTVTFVNTYDPADVSVNLDGAVSKELSGKNLEANQFTFYIYADGDRTTPLLTGTNDLNGNVSFVDFDDVLTFPGVGKYAYDIVEYIPDGAVYDAVTGKYVLNGMYYDPTIFDLVVEVTNDSATGKLVANYYFEDAVSGVVTFRNHYKATPTTYTLAGHKVLHGRAPRNGEFAFELYEGNHKIETVTNKSDGTFTFRAITYTEVGTYTYTIREADGNAAGVRYDGVNHPVTVTVTVTDTNGVLHASASVANANIKFENTYTADSAQVTFNGTKNLEGGTLEDNTFTFKLYSTDNSFDITKNNANLLATTKNLNGGFSFARTLTATGTYFFVIVEDATDPMADIVYDRTEHRFMVLVNDLGDGQLRAVVTNVNTGVSGIADASVTAQVTFTNATFDQATEKEVYLKGSTTQIDGKQVNSGEILTYFITYTNYTGADVVADIMDTIPAYTEYVEGTASHNGTYVGTHVNWILNVPKGESVTVSFSVKVQENDAIVANIAEVRDGVNTYKTNEVVNHTFENELEKDVVSAEDTTVSIDGKKVYQGDELIYEIRFTNTTGEVANVTVTDRIPENTTYVDGSADNGGVYDNGAITWNLQNIPAWGTVTVAFKVTVNANIGAAEIKNQATATDGTNDYETQWVTNYTVEDEVEKKVFNTEAPTVAIDGQEVKGGDILVYEISYKNTSTEKVAVTVTDKVPAYTTYVEGSADKGGIYHDGQIIWTMEVEPGATVTVSFKSKVDSEVTGTVSNKATVVEGKNTYTTNEVTTPITPPQIPEKPVNPNPQTGDNTNLHRLFAMLLVSCGGLFGTLFATRKKEETENG